MQGYKVNYHTYSKGKSPDGKVGNVPQTNDIAYVQCNSTSEIEALLEGYFATPKNGIYYFPVITHIATVNGHCIIKAKPAGEKE